MNINKRSTLGKKSISRINSLDSLRGYATIAMVVGHITQDYMSRDNSFLNALMEFLFGSLYGTQGDELFCTLIGMGIVLQSYLYQLKGFDKSNVGKIIIKRGLLLLLFGFFINAFFGTISGVWNWGIIIALGFLTIFGYLFSKISQKARIVSIILIIIIGPIIKYNLTFVFLIQNVRIYSWSIWQFLRQMFLEVTFCMFPFLVFPIIGTLLAEHLIDAISKDEETKFLQNITIIGSILAVFGIIILPSFYEIIEYPLVPLLDLPPRFDVIRNFGIDMLLLAGFYYFQDYLKKNWKMFKLCSIFGTISLSVFVLHLIVIPRIIGMFYSFYYSFDNFSTLMLICVFCVFYGIFGVINNRFNRIFSLEWLLRKLNY